MPTTSRSFASLAGVSPRTAAQLEKEGITEPFPVQSMMIPIAVRGGDVLAQAPTGSGKTLAFGIPIIEQLRPNTNRPTALVLVPTRELAVQVSSELEALCAANSLRIAPVFGGAPLRSQATRAAKAAIIVATPGRLDDLMQQRLVDMRDVTIVMLDEADRMLDMGFAPQVDRIVDRLPRDRQTMLLSATLDGATARMVDKYTYQADIVRVERERSNADIVHVFEPTSHADRVMTLLDILDDDRDCAAVFVRTKRGADRLDKKLKNGGVRSTALHGGMTQGARLRELKKFRNGERDVLVATDVFARGIDMDRITLVVNYDPPEDADTYMHRIGRTGRAGRAGLAISLVAQDQESHMKSIARVIGLEKTDDDAGYSFGAPAMRVREVDAPVVEPEKPAGGRRREARKEARRDKRAARNAPDSMARDMPTREAHPTTTATVANGLVAGKLKFFNRAKGYGFIAPDDGGQELFVHHKNVTVEHRSLVDGTRVSYAVEEGRKGPEAVRVGIA